MRRVLVVIVALGTLVSCSSKSPSSPTPTPTVAISEADLANGILAPGDVGAGWKPVANPQPDTFQIGGRVGSATYVAHSSAEQTVAFSQDTGSGFVSNTVFELPTVAQAQAVMTAQNDADQKTTWRQARDDGGYMDAKRLGRVEDVTTLGDDSYTARVEVTIKPNGSDQKTKRIVEYVAYRIGSVMSFVVAQDIGVAAFAKRQEARLARVVR